MGLNLNQPGIPIESSNKEKIKEVQAGTTTELALINPSKEELEAALGLSSLTRLKIQFDNEKKYR